MGDVPTARRMVYVLSAAAVVLLAGTLAFHTVLDEGWTTALYRSVVTSSLTGMDTVPDGTAGKLVSIVLILAGVSIFAYVASVVVETIARGVLAGAMAERRRRRAIESLEGHYIICGFGRVGRRVADKFRDAGVVYTVLDFSPTAIEAARERGDLFVEGRGTEDDDLAGTFDTTPSPDATVDSGDVVIAVGTPEELRAVEELFAPEEAVVG